MEKNKEERKEDSKPHFTKAISYAPQEMWRTDFLIGQKGSGLHGHLALSGALVWYLRDEQGKEIIVNGSIVSNKTEMKRGQELEAEAKGDKLVIEKD